MNDGATDARAVSVHSRPSSPTPTNGDDAGPLARPRARLEIVRLDRGASSSFHRHRPRKRTRRRDASRMLMGTERPCVCITCPSMGDQNTCAISKEKERVNRIRSPFVELPSFARDVENRRLGQWSRSSMETLRRRARGERRTIARRTGVRHREYVHLGTSRMQSARSTN